MFFQLCAGAYRGQKRMSGPLELELQPSDVGFGTSDPLEEYDMLFTIDPSF